MNLTDPPPLDIEDRAQLLAYLRANERIDADEEPQSTVLAGGVSNRVVLLRRANGEAWVLKQALEKLRVAVDWFSSPQRIHSEALGLRWLAELAPPGASTPLVFEDFENHILAMEAVPLPHENWKTLLLAGTIVADHIGQFAQILATVHRRASERTETLAKVFDDASFFESLRLEPYYAFSATRVPEAAEFLQSLIVATRARRFTLVHADFSPKNVLIHNGRLILLDHEVVHWGDPAFDVGFALTHLLSKAHHLPMHRAAFVAGARGFWSAYSRGLGGPLWQADLEQFCVRHTLACLLARVAGRSPLEYLDETERARQRATVLRLMAHEPQSVAELTDKFIQGIQTCPS